MEKLHELLITSQKKIKIGARYRHYKDPTKTYIVKCVGLFEDSLIPAVVYEAEYGARLTWIRKLDNFLEKVDVNTKKVPRFKLAVGKSS